MKINKVLLILSICGTLITMCVAKEEPAEAMEARSHKISQTSEYVQLSINLLEAVKNNKGTAGFTQKLQDLSMSDLASQLSTDTQKKAFWINIYNAYIQIILSKNPELFEDRDSFFGDKRITIAGQKLSFDDIEHGIIRGSKVKWLLGVVQNPFAEDYEKNLRVSEADGRIHFALNCGAKSCPAVAIYDDAVLDQQLDIAAKQYLNATTTYKAKEKTAYVTSLFSWFRGDFGGKDGVVTFLKKYDIIPEDASPSLEFKDYDWTLDLGNYKEINVKQ